jgi:hypothetical protein
MTPAIRARVQDLFNDAVKKAGKPGSKIQIIWAELDQKHFDELTWSYGRIGPSEKSIKLSDDLLLPVAGRTVNWDVQLNPGKIEEDVKVVNQEDPGAHVTFEGGVAATIAHEVGVHAVSKWWFHVHEKGVIDAAKGSIKGYFSNEAAGAICDHLHIEPK